MAKPIMPSKHHSVCIGLVALAVAWVFLYDAWEARDEDTPRLLRWVTPW